MLAGDCTVCYECGDDWPREERGAVLAVVKLDNIVLVHDREDYRPAAWLTRADALSTRIGGDQPVIEAVEGDRWLVVTCGGRGGLVRYPAMRSARRSAAAPFAAR